MRKSYDKEELLFHYQEFPFPSEIINKDVLIHRELIFNEIPEEPLVESLKKVKLQASFIVEEEIEPKSKNTIKKGSNIKQANKQPVRGKDPWRKNEPEESTGFFDDFKGKTDEKQVEKFKRNLEVSVAKETSISIENSIINDHLAKSSENKVETLKVKDPSSQSISVDSFFENAEAILGVQNSDVKKPKLENLINSLAYDPNPKVVSIDLIFKVNEYLNYPKEEKLWYIFHTGAKSSFGPLSSPNIKELYDSRMLDGESELRFIDIYNLKNKKPFDFFKLKEIENPVFLDSIEISGLLKIAVNIKGKNFQSKEKINTETNTNSTTKITDDKLKYPIPVKKKDVVINEKPIKENPVTKIDPDSIYYMPGQKQTPVIDENVVIIKKNEVITGSPVDKKPKKTTRPLSKPVEIDVKLGIFY